MEELQFEEPGLNTITLLKKKGGTIELSPRELVHPDKISEKTLHMIDKAVKKFKEGEVSEPIDFSASKQ